MTSFDYMRWLEARWRERGISTSLRFRVKLTHWIEFGSVNCPGGCDHYPEGFSV